MDGGGEQWVWPGRVKYILRCMLIHIIELFNTLLVVFMLYYLCYIFVVRVYMLVYVCVCVCVCMDVWICSMLYTCVFVCM